jgi:hypothetical protein
MYYGTLSSVQCLLVSICRAFGHGVFSFNIVLS